MPAQLDVQMVHVKTEAVKRKEANIGEMPPPVNAAQE